MINKLATILLSLLCFESFSQEPIKPIHQKKVFQKEGNIYVQKQMPLYLKFSVEPDGENYNFHSKGTPDFADPMYLDTEGINFIRSKWAVNKDTKRTKSPQEEILYEIYADGIAPTSQINFSGAPSFTKDGVIYYGQGLQISLSSKDWIAGVQQTYFALNGGYQNYNVSLKPDVERDYTIYFYATDNVGNVENTQSINFVSDLSPPSTSKYFEGRVHERNVMSPNTRILFAGNDDLSGVRETHAYFNEGTDRIMGKINFKSLEDGEHTVKYYSIDNVENKEEINTFDFYLDKIPPETEVMITGDRHKASSNVNYVSRRTLITLTSDDNKSGVDAVYYRVNGSRKSIYGDNIILPTMAGLDTISYYAEDRVGNASKEEHLFVHMDNDAPTTNIEFGIPQFYKSQVLYVTSTTKINFQPLDNGSGISTTSFAIDEGQNSEYEGEFIVNGEGIHSVSFFSTDNVNNEERVTVSRFHIDNTPPEINYSFSVEASSEIDDEMGRFKLYPSYTAMFLSATDKDVGTENIFYSIDSGPLLKLDNRQSVDLSEINRSNSKRLVRLKIVAEDKLGNRSEREAIFYVDGD